MSENSSKVKKQCDGKKTVKKPQQENCLAEIIDSISKISKEPFSPPAEQFGGGSGFGGGSSRSLLLAPSNVKSNIVNTMASGEQMLAGTMIDRHSDTLQLTDETERSLAMLSEQPGDTLTSVLEVGVEAVETLAGAAVEAAEAAVKLSGDLTEAAGDIAAEVIKGILES